MIIKFRKIYPDALSPVRASAGAVGYDVYAYHVVNKATRQRSGELPAVIMPNHSLLIGIGIVFAVPFAVDCQVRPRSGLANKFDVELSNSPGTVDPDYRGEIGILLRNRGNKPFQVEKGMRVAQLIFTRVEIPEFVETAEIPATTRGRGGFGSTGYFGSGLGDGEYRLEQAKWDRHFMGLAVSASNLSNCLRGANRDGDGRYLRDELGHYLGSCRRFGCVIVKGRNVVAQGFNTRTRECDEESGCTRETQGIESGTSLEIGCLHAEEVALMNYAEHGGPPLRGSTVYVNAEPCLKCAKLLAGCGLATVVVPEGVYPTNGLSYLQDVGVEIRRIKI